MSNRKNTIETSSLQTHVMSLHEVVSDVAAWPESSAKSFATCVRVLLQNWRQGTVGCKDRGEVVSRSNKKPWKQKGTGRARAGSPRSPLWRGGGVIFGPESRDRHLKVSKSLRRNVMRGLMVQFANHQKIVSLDWILSSDRPKTALAYSALKDANMMNKKIVLFLPAHDILTAASFANIPTVRLLSYDEPNVYDLANAMHWIVLKKDISLFKEMVSKWS